MSTLETNLIQPATGTTLTVGASGDTIDIPSGATLDATGATITGALTNTPAFSVYLSGNQSVASNTDTKITFDSEHYDTDNAFASNKFTVPSGKAGKYFFVLHWNSNTSYSNEMFAKIFKNGSLIRQMRNQNIDEDGVECCVTLDLADGDYIEGYARMTNNTTTILGSTDKTWFDGYKLIT